jgi:hypothetical protein
MWCNGSKREVGEHVECKSALMLTINSSSFSTHGPQGSQVQALKRELQSPLVVTCLTNPHHEMLATGKDKLISVQLNACKFEESRSMVGFITKFTNHKHEAAKGAVGAADAVSALQPPHTRI